MNDSGHWVDWVLNLIANPIITLKIVYKKGYEGNNLKYLKNLKKILKNDFILLS